MGRLYEICEIKSLNGSMREIPICYINSDGYAKIYSGNSKVLSLLKSKTSELKLPVLKRKWDLVPVNYSTRYEDGFNRKNKIIKLLKTGMTGAEIARKLNVSTGYVSVIKKKGGVS